MSAHDVVTVLPSVLRWVLVSSVQASVIAVLILLLQRALRKRLSPRWLYCLWFLVLARMVMPWAPESAFSVFNLFPSGEAAVAPVVPVDVPAFQPVFVDTAVLPAVAENASWRDAWTPWAVVAVVWLAGVLLFSGHVLIENLLFWRRIRNGRETADARVLQVLQDCKAKLGIRVPIAVVVTDEVKSPALFGFVRPRLLLPKRLHDGQDEAALRFIFLHELAHIKRRDILVSWVTTALQALHWFNPFIWFAFYRMRADRELACDALALSYVDAGQSDAYGRTIVDLLEHAYRVRRVPGMAGILEDKSQLERRIRTIALFKRHSFRWSVVAVVMLGTLGAVFLTNAKAATDEAGGLRTDLAAGPLTLGPSPEEGLSELTFEIRNVGDTVAPQCDVYFYVGIPDNLEPMVHQAGPIQPGETWRESTLPFAVPDGQNLFLAVIDAKNAIDECDETNNKAVFFGGSETKATGSAADAPAGGTLSTGVVGIEIGLDEAKNAVVVEVVMPGSSAEKAGLQRGDVIVEVDRQAPDGWALEKVAEAIRGPVGSKVELTLREDKGDGVVSMRMITMPRMPMSRYMAPQVPASLPTDASEPVLIEQGLIFPPGVSSKPIVIETVKESTQDGAVTKVKKALETRVAIEFEDEHIQRIVEFLGSYLDINIVLDTRVVAPPPNTEEAEAEGGEYATDGIVKYIKLQNVTLRDVLIALLRPLNLDWSIQPGFIWISTPDKIRTETFEPLETRRYALPDEAVQYGETVAAKIREAVPPVVEPGTDDTISRVVFDDAEGQLVVHTTPTRHKQIPKLLSFFAAASTSGEPSAGSSREGRGPGAMQTTANAVVAMGQRMKMEGDINMELAVKEGEPPIKLNATRLESDPSGECTTLTDVKLEHEGTVITAAKGEWRIHENKLDLSGDCLLKPASGGHLQVDAMTIDLSAGKLDFGDLGLYRYSAGE